ncbi:MAG: 4Fe-4S dicluster domain-containing protein, partial [Chloroflexota bacterium]
MAVTEPKVDTTHGTTVAESPGLQGFLNERDYEALVKCVHCGLCLNECPTYRANGLEPDSPRGRLYLIRSVSEGTLPVTDEVVDHLQLCLVCRACETACPSNVQFGQVMEAARHELLKSHSSRPRMFFSWLAFHQLFPYPGRLKLIGQALRLYQRSPLPRAIAWASGRQLIPRPLQRLVLMEQMAPVLSDRFFEAPPTERVPAQGERRYTVGMISGCIMPLAFAPTDEATVRVLAANGCDVIIPQAQRCCGALAAHSGDGDASADLARANIDAFEAFGMDQLDSIVINAAGCGAQLKNYGHILQDDPRYAERAARFAEKVEDVSEFLARIG